MRPFQPRKPEWVSGTRFTLLEAGREFFPALCAALDAAQHEIHLESYIFAADATGRKVADALCRAAGRGVAVRLMVDGFGSLGFRNAFAAQLEAAGARVIVFHRLPAFWSVHRLHRKVAVVDGATAFVGGINIVSDPPACCGDGEPYRCDYALKAEGPLAPRIRTDAVRLWNRACWTHFKRGWRANVAWPFQAMSGMPFQGMENPRGAESLRDPWTGKAMPRAAFLVRAPMHHRRDIERAYLAAITGAQREILIAHAYFLPGRKLRLALIHAAKRGVKVSLLLPGVPDNWLGHHASEAVRGDFLQAGVRLFSYDLAELHAKVAVVDDRWLTVGSSNLDFLSLRFAHEANIVAEDPALAAALRARLATLLTGARETTLTHWRQRPWPIRLLRWAAYFLVRTVFGWLDDTR